MVLNLDVIPEYYVIVEWQQLCHVKNVISMQDLQFENHNT